MGPSCRGHVRDPDLGAQERTLVLCLHSNGREEWSGRTGHGAGGYGCMGVENDDRGSSRDRLRPVVLFCSVFSFWLDGSRRIS